MILFLFAVTISNMSERIYKSEGYLNRIVNNHSAFLEDISLTALPYAIAVASVASTASSPSIMLLRL
jgi:hypothetical protein